MSWLLELLVDAIREMCSQFIVDMMELITNMFTELLSCNLSLFEELFSVVGSLYKNVIVPTGIAILLMILVWQLFKSMFGGKAGVNAEEPIELICRLAISLFLLAGSKPLVDYILRIAGTPYQWVVGTKVKVASFSYRTYSARPVPANVPGNADSRHTKRNQRYKLQLLSGLLQE